MKAWKRDMGRIRELGPDEPHFNSAVERVWDHIEELEAALRATANSPAMTNVDTIPLSPMKSLRMIAREALS